MKKNLYYHQVYQRQNKLKSFFLTLFLGLSSLPRLLIEVFTRKSFGERYFSLAAVITAAIILFFLPFVAGAIPSFNSYSYGSYEDRTFFGTITKNITWYLYLIAFLYFSWQRKREVDREPSVFDFARFSLSTGKIRPFLKDLELGGRTFSPRTLSTLIEPGIFFIASILLILLHQMLDKLFLFTSIIYSLSWVAAYHIGDEFIMDTIDEMICNEEMVDSFVDGRPMEETKGFEMHCKQPNDATFRRQVVDKIIVDDEVSEAF